MARTLTFTEELVVDSCWCGMHFAMPSNLHYNFTHNGTKVYCPLGHTVVIKETEEQRLRKKLEREQAASVALRDQLDAASRSNAALRGEITKAKTRAEGGACPCCNRSFVQLARHMKSKHPDYAKAD